MPEILVITPVKDALEYTLKTAEAIQSSSIAVDHKIYNDFSSDATAKALEENKGRIGYPRKSGGDNRYAFPQL